MKSAHSAIFIIIACAVYYTLSIVIHSIHYTSILLLSIEIILCKLLITSGVLKTLKFISFSEIDFWLMNGIQYNVLRIRHQVP